MKTVPLRIKKYRLIFRAAVLCAVLIGLLVSCGEGIQLFPFPATETSTGNNTFLSSENEIVYQFNAHRFEDFGQKYQKTKSQPDNFHSFLFDNFDLFKPLFLESISNKDAGNFAVSTIFKPPLFSKSGEGRAPPVNA